MSSTTVYYGTFVHSISLANLEIVTNGVLVVDGEGVIAHVEKNVKDFDAYLAKSSYKGAKVITSLIISN